jgi:LacI family gluconate utilization system Gnt-I transcriptional repressor
MRRVPGRRPVKIIDVAALANVAPMTVSRVLNAPERVAAETAARVRDAIEVLGYVPNLIAGSLSSQRSRMIAAVVPTIESPMFAATVRQFSEALDRAGYQVMLSISGYATQDDEPMMRAILSRRPDALLLTGAERSAPVRRMLAEAAIPVVEIWDSAGKPVDMLVGFDHADVGTLIANAFLAKGHRHFAWISASDPRAMTRVQAFEARIRAAGFPVAAGRAMPPPATITEARHSMRTMLADLPRPAALYCSSDFVAFGAVTEALARGIAVPAEIAAIGFGDFELGRQSEPAISTISIDGHQIGATAAAMLLARLEGRDAPPVVEVPYRLIERGTT